MIVTWGLKSKANMLESFRISRGEILSLHLFDKCTNISGCMRNSYNPLAHRCMFHTTAAFAEMMKKEAKLQHIHSSIKRKQAFF